VVQSHTLSKYGIIRQRLCLVRTPAGCVGLRRYDGEPGSGDAQGLLAEALPRRWTHVQGVAGQAAQVAASLALGEVGARGG
jgi:hypothetical protein